MIRLLAAVLLVAGPAAAQQVPPGTPIAPPPRPAIGDGPTVSAEPLVARPATRSCTVTLFERREFEGDAARPIAFAPPAGCPGPYAKIVIETDGDVTAGRQFDRSGFIALGGVNLFTGTTMEPRKAVAPHWHAERDVTDYAALFAGAETGAAQLTNFVDKTYTGHVSWAARLVFYPADAAHPASVPDIVLPIGDAPATIDAATPASERAVTLPRNVERLAIDVLALPQGDDEFWYTCVPDAATVGKPAAEAKPCGVPFRESEVRIDGRLAGAVPIYPWIYTGGMDPGLWDTIPGIETLAMAPYRVDLTPFAGALNDGLPHRIAVSVVGVHRYVLLSATLMAWRDAGRSIVPGAVDRHTLRPATVSTRGAVRIGGHSPEEEGVGATQVAARRDGVVTGHVDTSHGRVTTSIRQAMRFANDQHGTAASSTLRQSTAIDTRREVVTDAGTLRDRRIERFPLTLRMSETRTGAQRTILTQVHQELFRDERDAGGGRRFTALRIDPASRTVIVANDRSGAQRHGRSQMSVRIVDHRAGCYDRTIAVAERKVTAVTNQCRSTGDTPRRNAKSSFGR